MLQNKNRMWAVGWAAETNYAGNLASKVNGTSE